MSTSNTAVTAAARGRKATVGAFVGTAIEWYDFYIFGTAAALVFGRLFYPEADPATGLLASFATFWVGFLARPIGGLVFGHIGDRIGRKNTLVITLLLMGIATTCIGLLPTYASIGVAAPLLLVLLRAVQGLAVGGEWGGAVVLATESAAKGRKGTAGMWVQQGSPAGAVLASVMFLLVGRLPEEAFLGWGWRVPFLLSAVLVIVALVIRVKLEESEEFTRSKKADAVVKVPVVEVFRTARVQVFLGIGASIMGISAAYFSNTFVLSWTTTELEIPRQTMLNVMLVISILQFAWQPVAAWVSSRIGRTRLMMVALLGNVVVAVPMFLLIMTRDPVLIGLGLSLSVITGASYYAMLAGLLAASFPAPLRYTGVSVAYQVCSSIIGGSTPLVAQWLLNLSGGSPWAVVGYYMVLLLVTAACVFALSKRTQAEDIPAAESMVRA